MTQNSGLNKHVGARDDRQLDGSEHQRLAADMAAWHRKAANSPALRAWHGDGARGRNN